MEPHGSRSRRGSFVSELRRRRVFRAAGVYAAAAFVVLQAADLAVEPLELPGWTMKLLWVLALGGFPLTVALAWVFEVVPDGAAREAGESKDRALPAPSDAGAEPRPEASRDRSVARRALVAVVASAILVFGIVGARRVLVPTPTELAISAVAVLPFHVRGSEALGYLREGMVDLLSRNLDGAGGLRSVDPVRVIELAAADRGEAFGAASGGELARRIGAGQYVVGSVNAVAGKVRIHASLYELGDSVRALSTTEVEGDTTELFTLVDRLTAELLAGQPLGPASQPLARGAAVTSRSLPALKAYLDGERLLRDAEYDEATARFAEALEHDSAFALAHYRKGVTHYFDGDFAQAREAAARAHQYLDRLGRHDRLLAEAFGLMVDGDLAVARDRYRAILREYPDDLEARVHLGSLLMVLNPLEARPATEARALLEEVLEVDPQFTCILCNLLALTAAEGDWVAAERYARRAWAGEDGDSALAVGEQLVLAAARGDERVVDSLTAVADTVTAEDQVHSLHDAAHVMFWGLHRPVLGHRLFELSTPPDVSRADSDLFSAEQSLGRWSRAYAMVEEAWNTDAIKPHRQPFVFNGVLHFVPEARLPEPLLVETRRRLDAWQARVDSGDADAMPAWATLPEHLHRYMGGLAASRAGDDAAALAAADSLETAAATDNEEGRMAGIFGAVLRADIAYRASEPTAVLAALDAMELRVPSDRWFWLSGSIAYGAALRIEALLGLERYTEALRWLEHSSIAFRDGYYGFRQHRLALAHDALGNREQAAAAYAHLLAAYDADNAAADDADADEVLGPRVERARARLARLTAESPSTR